MTFVNEHLYLTLHWNNGGVPAETGQCGIRFDSITPPTQAMVLSCASAVQTFWAAATSGIEPDYRLAYLRLAQIGPNGKYMPGTVAYDHTYPGPVAGGAPATTARFPLQIASVATLLTALPRGQAYKGRIYLPWINSGLNSGYAYQLADVNNRANTLSQMISTLNGILPGKATIFSKGTKAAPTVGAKNKVTGLKIGTKPDVQRRRANREVEVYGAVQTLTA